METKLKKREVCQLIKRYYKEVDNLDVKVRMMVSHESTCSESVVPRIEVIKKNSEEGKKVRDYLSQDEVLGILNELLKNSGYEIISLSYDAGMAKKSVSHFMDYHQDYYPYFNGIILHVKTKERDHKFNLKRKLF